MNKMNVSDVVIKELGERLTGFVVVHEFHNGDVSIYPEHVVEGRHSFYKSLEVAAEVFDAAKRNFRDDLQKGMHIAVMTFDGMEVIRSFYG